MDPAGIAALKAAIVCGEAGQGGGPHQLVEHGGIRLHQKFRGRHFLPAEGVPEAQFRPQKKIEAVDVRKGEATVSGQLVARGTETKRASSIKNLAPSMGKGSTAMSHWPSCQAARTSAFWQMAEDTIFSGWASFSFRSSTHKGAGAQDFTTMVRCRWSKARTCATAWSAASSSFRACVTASCPASFSEIRFLPRVNRGTPKYCSRCCMERVTEGVET